MKISACVITKNEEKNIVKWLDCMKEIADEIIVVDTGSKDNTVETAKKYDAKVYEIKWENDFSAAKNYAIDRASGDWIIFLDADEYFTKRSLIHIKKYILEAMTKKMDGIICKIVNVNEDDNNRILSSFYNLRIFRNHKNLRYKNKIHEMISKKGKLNLLQVINDLEIYHTGYSEHIIKKKLQRNLDLINEEINEFGEKPWHYGFLADCYYGLKDYENTIKFAQLAIKSGVKLAGQENNVYRRLIDSYLILNKDEKIILEIIDIAIKFFPELPEFIMDKAHVYIMQKKYYEAEVLLNIALDKHNKKANNILVNNFEGKLFRLYYYLGEINIIKNETNKAIEYLVEALKLEKYNSSILIALYRLIKNEENAIIIDFLSAFYYENSSDMKFLYATFSKIKNCKIKFYYRRKLEKYEKDNVDYNIEDDLIAIGNYQEAEKIIKGDLDNIYKLVGNELYDRLKKEEKDKLIMLLPEKYKMEIYIKHE